MFRRSRETTDRPRPDADPKPARDVFVVGRKSMSLSTYLVESEDGEPLFWAKYRLYSRRIDVYDDPGCSEWRFTLLSPKRFSVHAEFVLSEPDGRITFRFQQCGEFTLFRSGWIADDADFSRIAVARGPSRFVNILNGLLPVWIPSELLRSHTEIQLADGVIVGRFERVPEETGKHRLVLDNDPGGRLDRQVALALTILLGMNPDA